LNLRFLKKNRTVIGVYLVLIVLFLFSSLMSDVFLTPRNVSNVLRQAVVLGFVSLGQTLVILTAGIDLSVGSVISLTSCLTAGTILGRDSLAIPAVGLVLALALLIGFCNGFFITRTGVPSLIVTLGTMEIIQGITLTYTDEPYGQISPNFGFLAWGQVGAIPFPVLLLAGSFALGIFVLRRRAFGRHIYAVGGNEEAARLSGIKTDRVKIYTYMICSFTAALTGLLLAARMGIGDPRAGEPFMLECLVPVLIGGTSLMGGKGGLLGTIAGVFILTILNNILNLMEVSGYWQWVVQGVIIIGAVAFYVKERE